MDKESLQLKCLANLPITIDNISIKPKTLIDIVDLGYSVYNQYLNIFCFNAHEVSKVFNTKDLTHYQYICGLIFDGRYSSFIFNAVKYFLNIDIKVHESGIMYYVKDNTPIIIEENTFNDIAYAIQLQNALIKDESNAEVYDPADAKAKAIIEKLKKSREKLNKAKKKNGDEEQGLTLLELISVVSCNCNNLNIINVWNLNLFQFNDQFNRMVLLDNYRVNIRALLAGAKQEEMEMENWMKKIH